MLTRQDLDAGIAECLAANKPTKDTCVYLAAFQTCKERFFNDDVEIPQRMMSHAAAPSLERWHIDSDSEFAEAFNRADPARAAQIIDELMDTLAITQPAVYRRVIRELSE